MYKPIKDAHHTIMLKEGTRSMRQQRYLTGKRFRKVLCEHIDTPLEAVIIGPAQSEWASPIALLPKKDSSLRFFLDYKSLNATTMPETYPLPRMSDLLTASKKLKCQSIGITIETLAISN